jgi:D-3-phosphoglycerate dehydrogenase
VHRLQTITHIRQKYKSGYGDRFAEEADLDTFFRETDILSVHIPYLPSNHYFIDAHFLDRFAKPIYLVNTARGLVLHTQDLTTRMKSGKVLGAALDVIEYEELSFEKLNPLHLPEPFQYLRQSDRAVLTPHIAGWSFESNEGHATVLAEKIERFLNQQAHRKEAAGTSGRALL